MRGGSSLTSQVRQEICSRCSDPGSDDSNEVVFDPHTEDRPLSAPDVGPLENLLIEHPSMSVYQMRCGGEEELGSDEEDTSRLRSVTHLFHTTSLALTHLWSQRELLRFSWLSRPALTLFDCWLK